MRPDCPLCKHAARPDLVLVQEHVVGRIARGLLTSGHTLLVYPRHVLSFAQLDRAAYKEYVRGREMLSGALAALTGRPALEFENSAAGAVTIPHAHTHILPVRDVNQFRLDTLEELKARAIGRRQLRCLRGASLDEIHCLKRELLASGGYLAANVGDMQWLIPGGPKRGAALAGFWRAVISRQMSHIKPSWALFEETPQGRRTERRLLRLSRAMLTRFRRVHGCASRPG